MHAPHPHESTFSALAEAHGEETARSVRDLALALVNARWCGRRLFAPPGHAFAANLARAAGLALIPSDPASLAERAQPADLLIVPGSAPVPDLPLALRLLAIQVGESARALPHADLAVALPDAAQPAALQASQALLESANRPALRPAIIMDRDGVICENRADYVRTWADFKFLDGAIEALHALSGGDCAVIVVSNQSAVGRGLTSQAAVDEINANMLSILNQAGARVDGVYLCTHAPEAACNCRKPRPAMLLQAAYEHGLDLSRSWMIGDAATDMRSGWLVGCRPIMVLTGRGRDQLNKLLAEGGADIPVARDLAEALSLIK